MPHLASGTGFLLAIVVEEGASIGREVFPGVDVIADQVDHFNGGRLARRRAQWPAGDCADVLFKL